MKKLLILFANGFPYGIHEPFLEHEYPLYREYFDKVVIVSACARGEQQSRQIDDPIIEVLNDYTLSKDLRSIVEAIPWVLTDSMFYKEVWLLLKQHGFSFRRFYDLLVFSLCGNHRARIAHHWSKKHPEYQISSIYSYWLHIPAYAAVRLARLHYSKPFTISRAHGYDLYLHRSKTAYSPFHQQLFKQLDEVAVISKQGQEYLHRLYGTDGKTSLHRLGAVDYGSINPCIPRSELKIVTCSRTIPLKRLDKLVDALSQISDYSVHWTHIGGGEAQEQLERYASEKLPSNITAVFTGTVPNSKIYEIYSTQPFHVFVNVSETEGIPVAIMEAMRFGIPVIATDVGGTSEVVSDGRSGYLLHKDFSVNDLMDQLSAIRMMTDALYMNLRNESCRLINSEFNAIHNYHNFLQHISSSHTLDEITGPQ